MKSKPGRDDFKRKRPFRSASKTFLVVTEGGTEKQYFEALKQKFRIPTLRVEVKNPPESDPISLVKYAKRLEEERSRSPANDGYDRIWAVFDLESAHSSRRAEAKNAKVYCRSIKCIESDPCFEYWILLHFEFTSAKFLDCSSVIQRLEKKCKKYAKGRCPDDDLLDKTSIAIFNAQQRRSEIERYPDSRTPSTDVDLVVLEITDRQE